MRKQFTYIVAVLLNTTSHLNCSFASPNSSKHGNLEETMNDFDCGNNHFASHNVERSYITGCYALWNDNSQNQFPAKLEDGHLVNESHRTLFSWPLKETVDTMNMRYAGKFRTVFDINCKFYGAVMREETGYISCIELSNHIDNNMISPDPNEYKGYKCQKIIFGKSYVQASLIAARETNLIKRQFNGYPIKISRPDVEKNLYEWPLFQNNIIYRSYLRIRHRSNHFIRFENESDEVHVIERTKSSWAICPLIIKTIVSRTHHSNSISADKHVEHDKKKSYDCSGQIFTDYYIQEVCSTLKNVISGKLYTKFDENNYPKLVNIAKIDATTKVWIWYLRISEANFQSISVLSFFIGFANDEDSEVKTSYMLEMSEKYQINGVYQVNKEGYIQCKTKNEPTTSQEKEAILSLDLNKDYPSCERCKDVTGCSCEENWHDPKRQKIS